MKKKTKLILLIILGIIVVGLGTRYLIRSNTKKYSPEETITHQAEQVDISVYYNRPYKKGRKIFGGLVPFGQVWRTGANEATTFTTKTDILIDGSLLKAGTYTLWTIPDENSWKVIFNGEVYDWGVSFLDGTPTRIPEYDALVLEVPAQPLPNSIEQFTIYFQQARNFVIMFLAWDQTSVAVPIKSII